MAGWLRWSLADALAIDLMSATAMNASTSARFREEVIGQYYLRVRRHKHLQGWLPSLTLEARNQEFQKSVGIDSDGDVDIWLYGIHPN
jgi:hypothetical protein